MAKKKIIMVGRDGRPSMLKVYGQMNSGELIVRRRIRRTGKEWLRQYKDNDVEHRNRLPIGDLNLEDAIVVRWGNRIEAPTNKGSIVYNKIDAIENATDKKKARQMFLDNKVSAPKLYTPTSPDVTFPIIARPLVHSKGKNFVVINNMREFKAHFKDGWYYSQYIDKDREFRVHVAHGKILAIMEKPRVEGQMAWNKAINHQAFNRVAQADYPYSVCWQALKAVDVLGLDFGGVDVIAKQEGDKLKGYVLEVNTSPTLNSTEFVSEQYAKYFGWLFASETRRKPWDWKEFKNPSSFAWKQNQF